MLSESTPCWPFDPKARRRVVNPSGTLFSPCGLVGFCGRVVGFLFFLWAVLVGFSFSVNMQTSSMLRGRDLFDASRCVKTYYKTNILVLVKFRRSVKASNRDLLLRKRRNLCRFDRSPSIIHHRSTNHHACLRVARAAYSVQRPRSA